MGRKSRVKGKRGELEVAKLFQAFGFEARRTSQVDGGLSSDVRLRDLPLIHVESKRYARIGAMRFMDQAVRDAAKRLEEEPNLVGLRPALFMREDSGPWRVMLEAADYLTLLDRIHHRTT